MNAADNAPRVIWAVQNGSSAGNMLRSGVLARVLDSVPDARVTLMSQLVADPAFTAEFAHARVSFEPLAPHAPRGLEARLLGVIQARYLEARTTDTLRIKLAAGHPGTRIRLRRLQALAGRALAPHADAGRWYEIADRLIPDAGAESVFDRYQPTLLIVATPGLGFPEIPLIRTAARRRVPTMAIDLSWDNLTNKLFPIRKVDRLVVWNSTLRREAQELHGYEPEAIDVAGAPQFDRYFNGEPRSSRVEFCRRVGLDPSRRIVTLTTIPTDSFPRHDLVVDALLEAMRGGAIAEPCDVLVRVHPREDLRRYDRFIGVPHVAVEKPFRATVASPDGHGVDVTSDNTRHLADTMHHSDVVLNVASTIAIEAAIFDTPVVNIAFDPESIERPFLQSPLRYYSYTHYARIVHAGAARLASSAREMIDLVNAYLADRSLDAPGRQRVVQEQCEFTDGRSAERVALAITRQITSGAGVAVGAPGWNRRAS